MSNPLSTLPEAPLSPAFPSDDAVDPELLALPAPPKREQKLTVALMALTGILSLGMSVGLRHEAAYALSAGRVNHVGDLRTADLAALSGTTVEGAAMLGASSGIRYERPFVSGSFRLVPVAGREDLFVETRVADGAENARYVPPATFSGRLLRFDSVGPKHRGLRGALEAITKKSVSPNAYLLVDGDSPATTRSALLLSIVFAAFAAWNAWTIAKLMRRVR